VKSLCRHVTQPLTRRTTPGADREQQGAGFGPAGGAATVGRDLTG
jgi:hypothetical protein